jgi:mannose-6-phosphate isomerase-like protein (cupin superfamily)
MTEYERPWGSYKILEDSESPVCVKIITVNPGCRLSLQKHKLRSEKWFPIDPGLIVQVGEETLSLHVGESIFVDAGIVHRISNETDKPVRLVELMYGQYDEEDIERLEDDYDRS